MGIRVEHGPSMVPVGRMAYRTGQNEYINRRRKELEALAEQRANRQQKSQMQINDINAGFQQIQMQHQQGMQRAAAQNQFQLDRDQRNHDWGVKAAGDLFNRQKELNDQRHEQGLARVEFGQDLQNQAMIDNNQAQEIAKTIDRLYGTSNQAGRDIINQFQAQQIKLRGHVAEGKITQEQYDTQYSEAKATLVSSLTGKNSELYQIGADLQVGGESIIQGGALKKVIGEGGAVIYQRNYGPEVEGEDKDKVWEDKYQKIQFNGPDDMIGYKNIYNMHTGEVSQQSMLPEWKAQMAEKREAAKLLIGKQEAFAKTAQATTTAEVQKDAIDAYDMSGEIYDRTSPFVGSETDDMGRPSVEYLAWQERKRTFQDERLTDEQRIAMGKAPLLREDQKIGGTPAGQHPAAAPAGQTGGSPTEPAAPRHHSAMPAIGQTTEMVDIPEPAGESGYTFEEARVIAWEQLQKDAFGYGLGIAELLDADPNSPNFEAIKQQAIEKQVRAMMEDGSIKVIPGEIQDSQGQQFDLNQQNKLQFLNSMNV